MGDRAPSEGRPYREGWTVLPEMEGAVEDELFTDLEAVREALDEVRCRAEAAGRVAVCHEALYEAVEEEMDRLRALLSGEKDGPADPPAPPGHPWETPVRGAGTGIGVYLAMDSGGFSHDEPLASVFVYPASYPQVLSDCGAWREEDGEDEVEIRSDAEMEAWLSRNWDLWKREDVPVRTEKAS